MKIIHALDVSKEVFNIIWQNVTINDYAKMKVWENNMKIVSKYFFDAINLQYTLNITLIRIK